jgi:hypothetical protein
MLRLYRVSVANVTLRLRSVTNPLLTALRRLASRTTYWISSSYGQRGKLLA